MTRRPTPLRVRLLAKVRQDASGCWIFAGRLNNHGYGRIWSGPGGRVIYAHRASYELFVGPIADGKELDHLCRKPACCNPAHLEAVDRRTNTLRSTAPTAVNAAKTECSRGHAFTEANTYITSNGRRKCRACGRENARTYARRKDAA